MSKAPVVWRAYREFLFDRVSWPMRWLRHGADGPGFRCINSLVAISTTPKEAHLREEALLVLP
jgi:hypothetical protein